MTVRMLLVLAYVLSVFIHTPGAVKIEGCDGGWIDLRKNATNTITVVGLDSEATRFTVGFEYPSQSGSRSEELAFCQHSKCELSKDYNATTERDSDRLEVHFILPLHGTQKNANVFFSQKRSSGSVEKHDCKLNVINPATLSEPAVEIDAANWTVRGNCHFHNAFSAYKTIDCHWQQLKDPTSEARLEGKIDMLIEPDQGYFQGICSLDSKAPTEQGRYIYSIDFYPGPSITKVGTVYIDPPNDPVTNCTQTVTAGQYLHCDCLPNPEVPGSPLPTVHWEGLSPGEPLVIANVTQNNVGAVFYCSLVWGPSEQPLRKRISFTVQTDEAFSNRNVNYYIGAGVTGVLIIAITIVSIVVWMRLRRQQKTCLPQYENGNNDRVDNDYTSPQSSPLFCEEGPATDAACASQGLALEAPVYAKVNKSNKFNTETTSAAALPPNLVMPHEEASSDEYSTLNRTNRPVPQTILGPESVYNHIA